MNLEITREMIKIIDMREEEIEINIFYIYIIYNKKFILN